MSPTNLIADIASGNTGTADVLFLIAVVLGGLSALAGYVTEPSRTRFAGPLLSGAVAAAALGLLVT